MRTETIPLIEHAIGRDGLLVLRLTDGDAQLTGIEGDMVTIRSTDGDALDGFDVERGDRSLEVRTQGADSADLDIQLPAGATVILEARSADVTVANLTGDVRLTTASGDLSMRGVSGKLYAEAVSGDLEIVAEGTLRAVARTVSGDLAMRAQKLLQLAATTTSGDLTVAGEFVGEGPFVLETVSGDTLLAPVGDVLIEVTTLTGDVHDGRIGHRSSRDHGPIVVGSGKGPTIAFRSTSGDLSIDARTTSAADASPEVPAGDDTTLVILQALERGEIDLEEASRRLTALDAADGDQIDA